MSTFHTKFDRMNSVQERLGTFSGQISDCLDEVNNAAASIKAISSINIDNVVNKVGLQLTDECGIMQKLEAVLGGIISNYLYAEKKSCKSDYTDDAKRIAKEFEDNGGYSCKTPITIEIDGEIIEIYPCCAGFTALLWLLHGEDVTPSSSSTFQYDNYGTDVTDEISTGDSLQVGDIIVYRDSNGICHVDIVVAKDDDCVYIANAGSDKSIGNISEDGYSRTIPLDGDVREYSEGYYRGQGYKVKGVKRWS